MTDSPSIDRIPGIICLADAFVEVCGGNGTMSTNGNGRVNKICAFICIQCREFDNAVPSRVENPQLLLSHHILLIPNILLLLYP